jgi:hypothetical protein
MKFDEAINYIAETTLDMEMAKPQNPKIQALMAQGMPYWKARKLAGNEPAAAAQPSIPAEPVTTTYRDLPDTIRTKDAVATYMQHNPNATEQEVMAAIETQNSEETPLNLDPEVIKNAISDAQMFTGEIEPNEPNFVPEPVKSSLSEPNKQLRRDKLMNALKKLNKRSINPDYADDLDNDEEDLDNGPVDMRDEPINPVEL